MKHISVLFVFIVVFCIQSLKAQIMDTIPVIIHIIHNGEPIGTGTNLSQQQIDSQLDVLNEDYRMMNADLINTPAPFLPLAADIGLNFAKATVDPNGNVLSIAGIERINRNTMSWTSPPYSMSYIDNTIKPQTIWNPYQYLNIWVVSLSGGMMGYSTLPANSGLSCMPTGTADPLRDGVVIHYMAFGRTGVATAPFDKGRSATFEIGRWLGLRSYSAQSSCDDCVSDTPPTSASHAGCPTFPHMGSSCSVGPNGDMFMNFMSYSDDACKSLFTQGQKARIDSTLTNGTFQSALRLSTTYQPAGIEENNGLSASVYPNPAKDRITIKLPGAITGTVAVYSAIGTKLLEMKIENTAQAEILLKDISSGVYMVQITAEKGSCSRRVVVSR
jgi:hypothetical protein